MRGIGEARNAHRTPRHAEEGGRRAVAPGHERLLTLARRMAAAATDGDASRFDEEARELAHLLVAHLGQERAALTRLPPGDARVLRRGQERLAASVRALVLDSAAHCPGPGRRCAARAEELVALLTLQARDERVALHHRAA